MRSAFVLGGTGQIGRAVAERLAGAGWSVTAASRRGTLPERLAALDVRAAAVDRDEDGALAAALGEGTDVLVDVIPYSARDADRLNALAGRVGSLVAISSAAVYADEEGRDFDTIRERGFPRLPVPVVETQRTIAPADVGYAAGKATVERALREGPLEVTVIRPGAVHGPGSPGLREWHFVKRILDRRSVALLPRRGESRFHTTAVVNLAELVALAAERPGTRVLNCGDPDAPSLLEIERAVAAALGHEWTEVLLPGGADAPRTVETPWSVPYPLVLSMAAAERELGYRPAATYGDAIGEAVAWAVEATRERDWRDVFPDLVPRMEESFDYAAEDELVRGLTG